MKKIAEILTSYVIEKGIVAEAEREVYFYGFQMGIELIFNIIVSILIAIKMNMIPQAAIFFLIFIPIRTYAGGFHFDSYFPCFILSIITYFGVLKLASVVTIPGFICIVGSILLIVFILFLFPVQNIRHVLDDEEKIYFSKKLNRYLVFDILLLFGLFALKYENLMVVANLTFILIVVTMVVGKIVYCINSKN